MQRLAEEKDCLAKNFLGADGGDTRKGCIIFGISESDHVSTQHCKLILGIITYPETTKAKNPKESKFIDITSRYHTNM